MKLNLDDLVAQLRRDAELSVIDHSGYDETMEAAAVVIERIADLASGVLRDATEEKVPHATREAALKPTATDEMVRTFCHTYSAARGFEFPDPTRVRIALEAALATTA